MKNLKQIGAQYGTFAVLGLAMVGAPVAYAATTADSQLSQQINDGVISTDFRNSSNAVVTNPTFSMGAVDVSTSQQTATGTYGDNARRVSVDNPGGANAGWTLALNATDPATDVWTSGSNTYDYNAATAAAGQLTVDPVAGTITPVTGGSTGVSKGVQATFSSSSSITIMQADATSADIWNGYITGVGLSQTIPASTPAGNYTLDMTQTVTAS